MLRRNDSTKNNHNSNKKYSHLSDDAIEFLQYCDKNNVNPIIRNTGKNSEFKTVPFQNGNPRNPDYYCIRHLATYSDRNILTSWTLYQLKDSGFLLRVNDFNNPVMMYHVKYDSMAEIADAYVAPAELIADAQKTLEQFNDN